MSDTGFVKAASNNLPTIDIFMISEFLKRDDRFSIGEVRGAKAASAVRESYGDSAIGYVQLKREDPICIVKAKICPEHKVRSKAYSVTLQLNEVEEKIIDINCHDCAASAGESDDEDELSNKSSNGKKDRYFWQYNVQAKGPKGQRLVMKCKLEDPHCLHEVTDPVFSPDCSVRGIKHSGKARKGDGNDLTPNPRKLYTIGKELDKLGRIINDMTPVSELPFNVRPTSRKEKNKLASRACRLKKKAQHEANKIKLSGLEVEHKRLINSISQAKQFLAAKLKEQSSERQEELTVNIEKLIKNCSKIRIAGHTTEYVNKVLDKLQNGTITANAEDS